MPFDDETSVVSLNNLGTIKPTGQDGRCACFIVLAGSQAGRMYKLSDADLVLGRASDAAISIDDDGISRRHARLHQTDDGTVKLEDLGSTNGTFCNGERVDSRVLKDGDKIQIGTTTILKFSYQDSIEEEFQRRQYESATRDGLTNCFNRKYFNDRIESEFAFAVRHDKPLSLAIIDIDFFKKVNDTYGHQAGDMVLRCVAGRINACIRMDDVLARYGGEEFGLILRETVSGAARATAERIRRAVSAEPCRFEDTPIDVTISVGIATLHGEAGPRSQEELVKVADEYLYSAKENGRNRVESAPVE